MTSDTYSPNDLKRLQETELEILEVLDTLCREHELDYSINSGTCLGAIRHGGFIPWDDDIDIALPYEDYFRFLDIAPQALPAGYSLHTPKNTPNYAPLWAKVFKDGTRFMDQQYVGAGCEQGIFVDVFPLYPLDTDPKKAKRQRARCTRLQQKSYFHCFKNPAAVLSVPFPRLVGLGCGLVHATVAQLWKPASLEEAFHAAAHTDNPSDQWFSAPYASYGPYPYDALFPTCDIAFDRLTVRAPADCDAYLTCHFGDYMTLPPEDKRHNHMPEILDFGD